MKLRVGVLQLDIALGDREKNKKKIADWMASVPLTPDIPTVMVVPELWDVGYALDRSVELADPEGSEGAAFLGGLAKKYGVWFVGGSVLASVGDSFVNRAQAINPKGELVAYYDKVHLIRLMEEEKYLTGGKKECIFPLEGTTAGCVICYDLRFAEWLRTYALKGVEVLFISAEWPTPRIDHWKTMLRSRAIENQMYVVACNRCGETEADKFGGASMIIGPWGEILFEAGEGEEAGFATIDLAKVPAARNFLTVFKDRVPEIYGTHIK